MVPDAAGVVVALLGSGNGAAEELGTTTAAEVLGATAAEELVVTATGVELLRGRAEETGFGAGAAVLKLAGRVMPLAAAQLAGESPCGAVSVKIDSGAQDDSR